MSVFWIFIASVIITLILYIVLTNINITVSVHNTSSSHKQLVIYRTTIICQAVYANIRHL